MSSTDSRHATAHLSLPVAHLIATVGASATMLAVMVTVAQGAAASWAVAAVLLGVAVPQIVLAPLAAPLLDRFGPRTVVVCSAALQVVLLLFAAAVPSTLMIIVVIAVKSCVSSLDSAALMLLVDRAPRANATDSTARAFARLDTARLIGGLIGPVLGGIAVQYLDISWLFVTQAATVAVLGAVAWFYPQTQPPAAGPARSWWQRVAEAPTLLFRNNRTRAALGGLMFAIVFTSFFSTAQTLYALDVLSLTPIGVAILTQCFVVGRLAGSRLGARVTNEIAQRWLLAATAAMGVGLVIPGVLHSAFAAGAGFAIAGLANAVQVAAIRLVVVAAVPEETRGRSLAAMGSVNQTAGVVGTALAAPVLVAAGPAGTLVVAGVGTLVAAALTARVALGSRSRRPRQSGAAVREVQRHEDHTGRV